MALPRATTAKPVLQKTVSIDWESRPQPPIRMQQLVQQWSRKMPPCWSGSKLVRNWSFETRPYQHNELRRVKQILIETELGQKKINPDLLSGTLTVSTLLLECHRLFCHFSEPTCPLRGSRIVREHAGGH